MGRNVVVLAGLVAAVVFLPLTVSAHAVLLRATPSGSQTLDAAPDEVQLLFSEPLDPAFSSIEVRDANGARVDTGDSHVDPENDRLLVATLKPGLGKGVYTVDWRSLSAIDVHPDQGEYRVFVGVPVTASSSVENSAAVQNTPTPEATLGRWWFYLAASLFGGVLAAWKLVLGAPLKHDAGAQRRIFRLVVAGGILLIVGTLYSAVAQAADAASVPLSDAVGGPLASLLLRGRFAAIWWPRLSLEVASLVLVLVGGLDGLASECALATLPAVLLTSALTSHGAALPYAPGPGIVVDWLHILGATAWVGGLLALLVCLPALGRTENRVGLLKDLVGRFGRFALVAAGLVLISGVVQGALELGSWSALTSTLYGQLLLVKIALLAGMLLVAAFNQWRGLGRGVGLEFALGVIVFGVAAVLSATPPPLTG